MISDLINQTTVSVACVIATGVVGWYINKKGRAEETKEKESRLAHAYVVELDGYSNSEKLYNASIAEAKNDPQCYFKYPNGTR